MVHEAKIALLIDCDNVSHQAVEGVMDELAKYGKVNIRRAYGNWKSPHLQGWETQLHPFAITPVQQFAYTQGKNATDAAMIIDAMDFEMKEPFCRIPAHWQEWVGNWASKNSEGKYDRLGANSFNGCVKLKFDDGSYALFEYAFYAVDEERNELAVFTEHCGYHIFSLIGLEYSYNVWAESPGIQSDNL